MEKKKRANLKENYGNKGQPNWHKQNNIQKCLLGLLGNNIQCIYNFYIYSYILTLKFILLLCFNVVIAA